MPMAPRAPGKTAVLTLAGRGYATTEASQVACNSGVKSLRLPRLSRDGQWHLPLLTKRGLLVVSEIPDKTEAVFDGLPQTPPPARNFVLCGLMWPYVDTFQLAPEMSE